MLRALGRGALAGVAWGLLARSFMRLFATDPEFTWSGTLAIVGFSAAFWSGVALVGQARREGRSAWWRLAPVPGLVLFMGPGMLLLPGAAGTALWRASRRRPLGLVALLAGIGGMLALLRTDATVDLASAGPLAGTVLLVVATALVGLAFHTWWRRWTPRPSATAAGGERSRGASPAAYRVR